MTGPFVVIWCSQPLRKGTAQDAGGILRFAPAPIAAQRFDTTELAEAAITATATEATRWGREVPEFEVLPLATWEDEQEAQTKRDEARAKRQAAKRKVKTEEVEA